MSKKLTFPQKNDFIKRYQTGDEGMFEKDKALFLKIFPTSPLVPQIVKANEFNRYSLNGRMLMDMLDAVCKETILENRGIIRDNKTTEETEEEKAKRLAAEEAAKKKELENELLNADIEAMKYPAAVSLFSRLKLEAEDRKTESVKAALLAKQEELKAIDSAGSIEEGAEETTEETYKETTEVATEETADTTKKNEDQGSSTQGSTGTE